MTSIIVARTNKEKGERFKAIIEATPSYMNFRVAVCPSDGEYTVEAETDYTDDHAIGMLNYIMFCALTK